MIPTQTNRSRPATPYRNRHSTVGAAEFFHGGINWMDIPSRLQMLVFHLQKDAHLAATETRSITLSNDPMEARLIALTAAISNSAPADFWRECRTFFVKMISWHVWRNRDVDGDEESSDEYDTSICEEDDEFFSTLFSGKFFRNLHILKFLNPQNKNQLDILSPSLELALYEIITSYVSNKISNRYNETDLHDGIIKWKNKVLIPLLQKLTVDTTSLDERLDQTISECYCQTRQKEIFDMIADYPDSYPSFVDLNRALQKTHKMNALVHDLKDALKRRLLHPGAQTGQIIQVYMDMIQVLRIMDPSDTLLNSASDDIRAYLRGRSDTVRCIITSLIDKDSKSDLYEELQKPFSTQLSLDQYPDSDDDEQLLQPNWNPAPSKYYQRISGIMTKSSPVGKSADLLTMLVRIYGSNDLFVDEYRVLLADKLLASSNFNTDEEVQNLELLMLRFGEVSMRKCDIMVKDIGDSKRISNNINSTIQMKKLNITKSPDNETIVDAAIISHIFWPTLQKQDIRFHPRIQAKLDEFSEEYHKYKSPRKLVWFQQLGQVELELDFIEDNGEVSTKEFTCSPIHATLISHFEDNNGKWTVSELSQETGLPGDVIRKKMSFWVNNNLVSCIRSGSEAVYELVSFDGNIQNSGNSFYDDDDGLLVSTSGREEEEWQTIEAFITGMLSNFGSLPLDRIQNMLKTYAAGSEHGYKKSPHQLSVFLQEMCSQHKIECGSDGHYKLIKK